MHLLSEVGKNRGSHFAMLGPEIQQIYKLKSLHETFMCVPVKFENQKLP
jgi:hypothetical protein